jgi:hypothetical protein
MKRKGPAPTGAREQGKVEPTTAILPENPPEYQAPSPAWQPAAVQRARILSRLRIGPATTLQLRNELHVMHPGGRIMELRRLGVSILSRRLPSGMAEYHLVGREVGR